MTDVRILTEPLGGTALSELLQRGAAPAEWLPRAPRDADGWRAHAHARRAAQTWNDLWPRLMPAIAPSGLAAERLARVQREGGVVVTTGQQPGLFGGPTYTWSKAVGALAFADALESATGVPTAVVFWAATDDADFAEASTTWLARAGGLDRLRAEPVAKAGTPMALAPTGELHDLIAALGDACGSAADARPLDIVRAAYSRSGQTMGGAYVELLRGVLAPIGIPVLDASHPAIREAGAETLTLASRRAREIEHALAARASDLRAAGFEPQVEDMPGLSLLFRRDGSIKQRMTVLEASASSDGQMPNVLLRPILEHRILPTVAYWAGPGELAYFAQVSAVAEAMALDAPLALPRWSCTLLEPHVNAALQRLGLQREDFSTLHAAERRLAREAMDPGTASGLETIRATVDQLPALLGDEPKALGLSDALEGARRALEFRVDRLERRLLAGVARRESARMRDAATARAALYPEGRRQERMLNLVPTLARHGLGVLDDMRRAAGPYAENLVRGAIAARTPATVA